MYTSYALVGGFCEPEFTNSTLYGTHAWPETGGDQTAIIFCEYGVPFGRGTAFAVRSCISGGTWAEPDFTACRDGKR